jgi:hypothetical protein
MRKTSPLACFLVFALLRPALANDTAASLAAGGIVFRREPRVSMEKERLAIRMLAGSKAHRFRVDLEYEFLNRGTSPVTTEVAFVGPPLKLGTGIHPAPGMYDFRVWAEDVGIRATRYVRALVDDDDVTPVLRKSGIDVEDAGTGDHPRHRISKPPADRAALVRAGLAEY